VVGGWKGMEHGDMILTWEKFSTGRNIFERVGGRCMIGYGAMME